MTEVLKLVMRRRPGAMPFLTSKKLSPKFSLLREARAKDKKKLRFTASLRHLTTVSKVFFLVTQSLHTLPFLCRPWPNP